MSGQWRPLKVTQFDQTAAHVINQGHRETNARIDSIVATLNTRIGSSAILNFGTIAANTSVDRTVYLVGANQQLVAHVSPQLSLVAGLHWAAMVSAKNQVTVRLTNSTVGSLTPPVIRWNIVCQ